MNNASIDDSQRISVLASCPNNSDASQWDETSTSNDYIKTIKYKSFAPVKRQMDRDKGNSNPANLFSPNAALTIIFDKNAGSSKFESFSVRKFMNIQQVIESRRKS